MKFSVIIPTYNKAHTVLASVESILKQTVSDYEIVVVDDGSKDHLKEVLEPFFASNFVFISQENGGVSVARNTGISAAKGEFVCFLDADDIWRENHLETLEDLISRYPDSKTFITSHEIVTPDGRVYHSADALKGYEKDFETENLLELLNKTDYTVVHTNSMCISRDLLMKENIRFEAGVKIGEDTDVWFRTGLKNKVCITKSETTSYRQEYSTATKNGTYVKNWIFSLREKVILSNVKISEEVKKAYVALIDRYKMTGSRESMAEGNRKEAVKILSEVKNKSGKRYVLTRIFTFLPHWLCRKLLGR